MSDVVAMRNEALSVVKNTFLDQPSSANIRIGQDICCEFRATKSKALYWLESWAMKRSVTRNPMPKLVTIA